MFSSTSKATYDNAVAYTITYSNTNSSTTGTTVPFDDDFGYATFPVTGEHRRETPMQKARRYAVMREMRRQDEEFAKRMHILKRLLSNRASFWEAGRPKFVAPPKMPRDAVQARFTPVDVSAVRHTRSTRRTGRWRWKNWRD